MKKGYKILLAIPAMIAGFILDALAWDTSYGSPVSSIFLLVGVALLLGGFIFIIYVVSRPDPVYFGKKESDKM